MAGDKTETVLVVDDDALTREMARDMMSPEGYTILLASEPDAALDVMRSETVDLILLDIVLPGRSGLELIPEIKLIEPTPAIIIMTAYASLDTALESIHKGAYDYIKKPLLAGELLNSVNRALECKKLQVENATLIEKLWDRVRDMEYIENVTEMLTSTLDLRVVLEKVMTITKITIECETCSIILLNSDTGELEFVVALGERGDKIEFMKLKPGQGIAWWVLENRKPAIVHDVKNDPRFYGGVDENSGFETRSMIAVPLFLKDKTVGVIEVINKLDDERFDEKDQKMLTMIARQIAIAIDNARLAEDLMRSKTRIEEYSKDLETMVFERTHELRDANYELKNTQTQLLQSEKLSSLGQLSAGIAHEINNPMGFISSNLQTLSKYVDSMLGLIDFYDSAIEASDCTECLDEIEKTRKKIKFDFLRQDVTELVSESLDGAERVRKIVSDLKLFSRADNAEKKFLDLHKAIDSTLNIVWNEIKYKAEVVKEYGEIPDVECLPVQLNQVFMNLLVNAAQAIKDKGTITIKTYSKDERVFVLFSDTGTGIAESNINRIFDPFFTTKEPGKGTGLGLSMAYTIIQKHNGKISVESTQGAGTTFTIELPLVMAVPEGVKTNDVA